MESVEFYPIDVEQTSWAASSEVLSQLRHQVFVIEQGIPADEEFDTADADAVHWMAFDSQNNNKSSTPTNRVIGCARLCGDTVGRMAVLESHRNIGVGSALLRSVIRYAFNNGMQSLQLNAQTHALDFYKGMQFESDGEEFIEAGIPHRHMTLSLKRFIDPKVAPALPDISAEERQHILLDDAQSFNEQATKLITKAQRKIRIFSNELDPQIYDNEEFYRLMFDFARAHPYAEIHLLIKNPKSLVQSSHRLLHLYHRLPSRIQMKSLHQSINTIHSEFLLIDQKSILYNQDPSRYTGYVVYHAPLEAVELADSFDTMWERSEADPEFRRLPL